MTAFRLVSHCKSLQLISLCNHPKLNLDDFQQLISASITSSLDSIIMTGCCFSKTISTNFMDAITSKLYSEVPLKRISFQTVGCLSELDKASLKQIWLEKWPEYGRCDFLGGRTLLFISESWHPSSWYYLWCLFGVVDVSRQVLVQ